MEEEEGRQEEGQGVGGEEPERRELYAAIQTVKEVCICAYT